MKLRLVQKGFESYNGQMGVTFFKDGLSTSDVLPIDAIRMAAVMGCEWENGQPANVAQILLDEQHTAAPSVRSDEEMRQPAAEKKDTVETSVYTREELEKVADEGGINALRLLAAKHDLKNNSIKGLIQELLKVTASQ